MEGGQNASTAYLTRKVAQIRISGCQILLPVLRYQYGASVNGCNDRSFFTGLQAAMLAAVAEIDRKSNE
jgi:hypothetical protein